MNNLLWRWWRMPGLLRWSMPFLLPLLPVLLFFLFWLRPQQQKINELRKEWRHDRGFYQQQLLRLQSHSSSRLLQQHNQQLRQAIAKNHSPFLMDEVVKLSQGRLQKWHPFAQGGELTLSVNWMQLQKIFDYLLSRRPAVPQFYFLIKAQDNRINAVFHLTGSTDETR